MPDLKSWFVIINPKAGNGKALKKWPDIQRLLKKEGFDFEYSFSELNRHNNTVIVNAIKKGFSKFISIGGDGTLHYVVNGLMSQNITKPASISIGIIPIGTGNDWVKNYAISTNINQAIQTIKKGHTKIQDVGKISFLSSNKTPVYFVNIAGIGFDAFVAKNTQNLKRFGTLSYLISALLGMFRFKNFKLKLVTPEKTINTKSLMTLVGVCKFSGNNMRLTNTPNPNDGLFDISIIGDVSKWEIIKHIFKLYNGKLHTVKKVNVFKSNSVVIEPKTSINLNIQADGEVFKAEKISVLIIKNAFTFYC